MGNSFAPGQACPPIYNPPVPYRHSLSCAPSNGTSVSIFGNVPPHAASFAINLETSNGDVAFHFNPRFKNIHQVVRNASIGGQWGPEEKSGPFPFAHSHPFEVNIRLEHNKFQVAVNRNHYCDFSHRISRDAVNTLIIKGDVQITQIHYQPVANLAYPSPAHPVMGAHTEYPSLPPPYSAAVPQPIPIYNPSIPFNSPIPGGSDAGRMIRINGVPNVRCSRFSFNLVAGHGFEKNADVNMQLDVRVNFGKLNNVVVRTHRQGGQWGQEETDSSFGPFPFFANQPFELILRLDHDKYCVAVNGRHMYEFRYRLQNLRKFNHLFIKGDVQINQIQFQ